MYCLLTIFLSFTRSNTSSHRRRDTQQTDHFWTLRSCLQCVFWRPCMDSPWKKWLNRCCPKRWHTSISCVDYFNFGPYLEHNWIGRTWTWSQTVLLQPMRKWQAAFYHYEAESLPAQRWESSTVTRKLHSLQKLVYCLAVLRSLTFSYVRLVCGTWGLGFRSTRVRCEDQVIRCFFSEVSDRIQRHRTEKSLCLGTAACLLCRACGSWQSLWRQTKVQHHLPTAHFLFGLLKARLQEVYRLFAMSNLIHHNLNFASGFSSFASFFAVSASVSMEHLFLA